jgi:alpha-L-fucosidase
MNSLYGAGYQPFPSSEKKAEYNQIVQSQLAEIWSNYGELFEIWFDGGVMVDEKQGIATAVQKLLKESQPHAILFQGPLGSRNLIRWVGNEDGRAPSPHWSGANATTSSDGTVEINDLHGDPDGNIWCPAEADFPNRKTSAWNGGWLWKAGQDEYVFPAEDLLDRYYTSVGRNANMMIGMAIDTSGRFPSKDSSVFAAFGATVRRLFSDPLATASGSRDTITISVPTTSKKTISHLVIREDISHGERIRQYTIEVNTANGWQLIENARSIGHKRIVQVPIPATAARLTVRASAGQPAISEFTAY